MTIRNQQSCTKVSLRKRMRICKHSFIDAQNPGFRDKRVNATDVEHRKFSSRLYSDTLSYPVVVVLCK